MSIHIATAAGEVVLTFPGMPSESRVRARCANQAAAERAAKLLNEAQVLNHRHRKYTAAAKAIAKAECVEGFEWNELEEIGSQGGES